MDRSEFVNEMERIFEETGVVVKDRYKLEADSLQYIMLISSIEETIGVELPDEFLAFSAVQNKEEFIDAIFELVKDEKSS